MYICVNYVVVHVNTAEHQISRKSLVEPAFSGRRLCVCVSVQVFKDFFVCAVGLLYSNCCRCLSEVLLAAESAMPCFGSTNTVQVHS